MRVVGGGEGVEVVDPAVAVADMITLITLQRMALEDPWAAALFGAGSDTFAGSSAGPGVAPSRVSVPMIPPPLTR